MDCCMDERTRSDVRERDQTPVHAVRQVSRKPSNTAHDRCCYICLTEGALSPSQQLAQLCKCPGRFAHPLCSARWQLHSAGREEEKVCRFCKTDLPDWKGILTQSDLVAQAVAMRGMQSAPAAPLAASAAAEICGTGAAAAAIKQNGDSPLDAYMRISYGGRSHKIKVKPGPDGSKQFVEDCRLLLDIPQAVDFDVVFHCKEPFTGGQLSFRTLAAFDAAVACAALASAGSSPPSPETDSPTEALPPTQPDSGPSLNAQDLQGDPRLVQMQHIPDQHQDQSSRQGQGSDYFRTASQAGHSGRTSSTAQQEPLHRGNLVNHAKPAHDASVRGFTSPVSLLTSSAPPCLPLAGPSLSAAASEQLASRASRACSIASVIRSAVSRVCGHLGQGTAGSGHSEGTESLGSSPLGQLDAAAPGVSSTPFTF